jgi:hypothetical protein
MGYETNFTGTWDVTPPLSSRHRAYLDAFYASRRQTYHAAVLEGIADPLRVAAGLPIGEDGCYFVNEKGVSIPWTSAGLDLEPPSEVASRKAVKDTNRPPAGQPSLWCGWLPSDGGEEIYGQDGKFYDYIDWAKYIVTHFLEPWGYKLNGTVEWRGQEDEDRGQLTFTDNALTVVLAQVRWRTAGTWTVEGGYKKEQWADDD